MLKIISITNEGINTKIVATDSGSDLIFGTRVEIIISNPEAATDYRLGGTIDLRVNP